ncbi:hypothetical protein HNY73_006638 [Argiope bruennichi]|uniref:Uncharacterized protein n=1 Tax=Argiope bruennichi TaxID=94029 RepID=A0A8T0FCH1_ARGBR|nr:hypothetical protein HNY73_006638 [Argiope bruennichi]
MRGKRLAARSTLMSGEQYSYIAVLFHFKGKFNVEILQTSSSRYFDVVSLCATPICYQRNFSCQSLLMLMFPLIGSVHRDDVCSDKSDVCTDVQADSALHKPPAAKHQRSDYRYEILLTGWGK